LTFSTCVLWNWAQRFWFWSCDFYPDLFCNWIDRISKLRFKRALFFPFWPNAELDRSSMLLFQEAVLKSICLYVSGPGPVLGIAGIS